MHTLQIRSGLFLNAVKKTKRLAGLVIILAAVLVTALSREGFALEESPAYEYSLAAVHQVNGRQGVCVEGGFYWVSGSTTLTKYDANWNIVAENTDPFKGYELEVNHIGDIDVYQNELYLGVEYFMDGVGKNIQVAVYDGDTLELKRVFPFREDTGQLECAGIAVDSDSGTVYMVSWIDDESSRYLYMYDLETGDYRGRLLMEDSPQWLQGIAYFNGSLYVTCDDGDADLGEPDHMYRIDVSGDRFSGRVSMERAFDDMVMQGEIEGLSFDRERGQFLLLYNHGARIVLGMPRGFYDGYTEEIHEVYVYDISTPAAARPAAGGWKLVPHEAEELPEDAQAAFNKAVEKLDGAEYTPVSLMATQLVSGMNYCILCQVTPVVPRAETEWALVYIYADLHGNAEVMNVYELYIDRHSAPGK